MAKTRNLSKAQRAKLSRAAKARPRYKTGPKKGKFMKGGARKRRPAKKNPSKPRKRRKGKKRAARRAPSAKAKRSAAARRAIKGRRRDSKGRLLPTGRSSSRSRKPRKRRDTGNPTPFPLDLALLNPASMESIKTVAKTGAGVAAGIMSGVGTRHLLKLPVPGVSTELSKDILAEVVQAGTPMVLGFGLGKLGWTSVGSGMMAAGAGMAILSVVRRIADAATDRKIPGVNRIDLGMAGDGSGVVFLRDARGQVFMQGPNKRIFRLNGLGQGKTEPVVRVLLENGERANFGFVGNIKMPSGKAFHVVRDRSTDELSMLPYIPERERRNDVRRGRARPGTQRISGVVERTSQFNTPRRRKVQLGGVVTARSQFRTGSDRRVQQRLSGVVTARSQFKPNRSGDPGVDGM